MSDMIKREDAITAINELSKEPSFYHADNDYWICGVIEARDAVENVSSADRWIPCSERLPNENEWVLCSCNNGFAILILKLKGNVWHKTEFVEYLSKFVNAWMPLPKPWKGADDEVR